ncbi:MAG: acetate--CoA ligase, partial [Candidatus Thermoplasmatota archaeon]|nr:acetate--CoA ligase [Candidatus Thermoplasmatota archaeon]
MNLSEEISTQVFKPSEEIRSKSYVKSIEQYKKMYNESIKNPNKFWGKIAEEYVSWYQKWKKVLDYNFTTAQIKYFEGAKLNVSYNCLDRHVENGHGNDIALIWEGNEPSQTKKYTYKQLLDEVQKFSNVLKSKGIKKGDRVCIYLQMIPELPIAMLACARIGAIHSVVFGGFSAESLRDRINDSSCKILITQDAGVRGSKSLPMKVTADRAVVGCPSIESVIVVKRLGENVDWSSKDYWWHEEMKKAKPICPPEHMDAEDPLFILYTSGSTGKPKGVLHTTGGYLVYAAFTHKYIFDYHEGDVYWCTADIGWVTGHTYIVYGPLTNKAISLMFEGVPNYPDWGRFWAVCEKHKVNIFYTAPTALRALMREGDQWVKQHDLSSLRILGSVGEPIKAKEWYWYYNLIGGGRCPIVDTWWQTETGGILITPLP